jgi:hypothetical protein
MPKSNSIRWTINAASKEFGTHRQTLAKKLATLGIIPDKDDECFSTYQIFSALNGDAEYKAERLRKLREEADRVQDENAANRLKYIEKREVYKFFDLFLTGFRAHVLSCPISQDEKDEILTAAIRLMDGSLEQYIRDARDRRAMAASPEAKGEAYDNPECGSEQIFEP